MAAKAIRGDPSGPFPQPTEVTGDKGVSVWLASHGFLGTGTKGRVWDNIWDNTAHCNVA